MTKWIAGVVLVAAAAACSGKSKPKALTVVEACTPEHDKQVVTVEAFTNVPSIAYPCATICEVDLTDVQDYSTHILHLNMPVGTGPMTMEALPDSGGTMVPASHFTIVDSDGKRRTVGAKVRITGTIEANSKVICSITPTEIHQATAE